MHEYEPEERQRSLRGSDEDAAKRAGALQRLIKEFLAFSDEDRRMLLQTVATFFGLSVAKNEHSTISVPVQPTLPGSTSFRFNEDAEPPSPKVFLLEKAAKTDVERVACLAYYLSRYRGVPHFKTKDISALNIESAHRRLSNTALSVDNATKMGYLVPSIKGSKQISAAGERYVEMLPDREAARSVMEKARKRPGRQWAKKRRLGGEE